MFRLCNKVQIVDKRVRFSVNTCAHALETPMYLKRSGIENKREPGPEIALRRYQALVDTAGVLAHHVGVDELFHQLAQRLRGTVSGVPHEATAVTASPCRLNLLKSELLLKFLVRYGEAGLRAARAVS